jgi:hypothetical protein
MYDLFYIAVMVLFVVVSALFVIGCDKLVGPDDEVLQEERPEELSEQTKVAA